MIEDALQNALDGVWSNTIGRLSWIVPDWVAGLLSLPFVSWVAIFVALAFMYSWGKFGFAKSVLMGIPAVLLWLAGRRSKAPPVKHAKPPEETRSERKTLFGRLFQKR